MSYATMVMDFGFGEFALPVEPATVLDEALRAWAEEDNDGCVITIETSEGSWHFNPEQHGRFVSGPVAS